MLINGSNFGLSGSGHSRFGGGGNGLGSTAALAGGTAAELAIGGTAELAGDDAAEGA